MKSRLVLCAYVTVGLLLAACGDDDQATTTTSTTTAAPDQGAIKYGAQVASYDLAAERPQRFLVALVGEDNTLVVGGEVALDFRYFGIEGPGEVELEDGELRLSDVAATFAPVAAGTPPPEGEGPRAKQGDEGIGIYEATGVDFGEPGYWSVTVKATVDGRPVQSSTAFKVEPEHRIVNAGDQAPRTVNLLPGDPSAPVKAVDSRAEDDGTVPDPELHEQTVADAIATGKPTLVVVSTPVFCVSKFCGPITDAVQTLVPAYSGRANFVHIEVWRDFEANALNKAAAEWIYPDQNADAAEPWVFLIDSQGTVLQRWDNIANIEDVDAAVAEAVA